MDQITIYRNNNECTYLLTFDTENVLSLCELNLEDFGTYLNLEQWHSILMDQAVILNSERDKQAIYLLQLACADIISPIRQRFMKVYVNIEKITKS